MTTKEMLEKWNNGEEIESVEMGGLGDGYENAIQQMAFRLCELIIDDPIMQIEDQDKIKEYWNKDLDKILLANLIDDGITGAQAGAIKDIAFKFAKYGYGEMMSKAPKDRIIKVKKQEVTNA